MLNICESNRDEIEREFMALVLHKNDVIKMTIIKPQYLKDKALGFLLKQCIECYNEFGIISHIKILEKHADFDIDLFFEIFTGVFWYQNSWREQLDLSEESIIKFYKEDIIKNLNEKLKKGEIEYNEFVNKVKKLDEIKIVKDANVITKDEIQNNIAEQQLISFNKFKKLGGILKLAQNDLLVIGSMTGTGKTGFMLNLMSDLMEKYQCVYFNMEMSKSSIYKRIIAINGDIPVNDITNPTPYQDKLIKESIDKIDKAKVIMEHQVNNIAQIKAIVSKKKDKTRHTVIFIDHLGLTRIDGKNSLYEQMTEIMKELRLICLEYDCTIIGASQLNRTAYTSDELSLSMLKDSGELENSARKIILLYRDKDSDKEDLEPVMNVDICKNDSGATGIMKMRYYKIKQIFTEEV